MKHTPGPWEWYGDNDLSQAEDCMKEILANGCCGGYGSCGGFIEWGDNKEANQKLIAAAPELLEALKELNKAVWDNLLSKRVLPSESMQKTLNKAIKVIKKAEEG